jgi:hypothetical protein
LLPVRGKNALTQPAAQLYSAFAKSMQPSMLNATKQCSAYTAAQEHISLAL